MSIHVDFENAESLTPTEFAMWVKLYTASVQGQCANGAGSGHVDYIDEFAAKIADKGIERLRARAKA